MLIPVSIAENMKAKALLFVANLLCLIFYDDSGIIA
jgi:hypothetical protein